MLIEKDLAGAVSYVKQTIADLLQNKVDMSQLVITKALSKSGTSSERMHRIGSPTNCIAQTTRASKRTSNSPSA